MRSMPVLAAAGLCLFASVPVRAEVIQLHARLFAATKPPAGVGQASGTAKMIYDSAGRKLTWTITFAGLESAPTGMALVEPRGKKAGGAVVVPIAGPYTSPMQGSAHISPAQAQDLRQGNFYLEIRTRQHPQGEIRGRISTGPSTKTG